MKMSTATKGKRPMRHLTASDKIEAIQRIHDGESKASVARDIGVPESTLRGWCKNEDKLRYMSRQSTPDSKMDKLTEDAVAAGLLGQLGPPEKRPKMDTSLPLNFATNGGKLKYDDLGPYKSRPSLNGLDLSSNSDLNGLSHSDFSAFAKSTNKGYGADLSKPQDPTKGDISMAAISPLTSLSHLSGMSSLGQSPLALSFNEIATNLNLIAQFNNPNLAAMSGLNQLNSNTQSLRNVRPKTTSVSSNLSPRSNNNNNTIDQDKINQGLTVKNLSKLQKNDLMGMNLSEKNKKLQTQIPTINRDAPVDDALWYWLKSQQAMLGLNNLYSSITQQNNNNNINNNNNNLNSSNSNLLNSPQSNMSAHHLHHQTPPQPQQQQQIPQSLSQPQHHPSQTPTPPIVSSPQITPPSSTPSAASDDTKNSSWFWQWYKTFGSSLLDKQNTINNNNNNINTNNNINNGKITSYENILYSQLTKGAPLSDSLNPLNNNNNISNLNNNILPKPEDLSQHSNNNINNHNNNLNNSSHILNNNHNITHNNSLNITNDNISLSTNHNNHLNHNGSHIEEDNHSDHGGHSHDLEGHEMNNSENNIPNDLSSSSSIKREELDKSPGKVRAVLDDLLYNNNTSNNNNNINNSNCSNNSNIINESSNNNNNNTNNNNNNDIKSESDSDTDISSPLEACEHGEKFLKWLETYSDPSVTAMQVMQFRYLLNTIKTSADRANNPTPVNEERIKIRRRK